MKTISLILISFLPLTAFGRIGEDRAECLKRYGEAQFECDVEYEVDYSLFEESVYKIHAKLWDGVVHQMGYTKEGDFTDLEVAHILKVNAGKSKWRRVDDSRWMTRNGSLTAVRKDGETLTIFTTKYGRFYWDNKKQENENEELASLRRR